MEAGTTVQNNQALGGAGTPAPLQRRAGLGGDGFGGGLYVAGGTATLTNVTLSFNTARGGQGGVAFGIGSVGNNGGNGFGGARR